LNGLQEVYRAPRELRRPGRFRLELGRAIFSRRKIIAVRPRRFEFVKPKKARAKPAGKDRAW
jgi:hypothetical protein